MTMGMQCMGSAVSWLIGSTIIPPGFGEPSWFWASPPPPVLGFAHVTVSCGSKCGAHNDLAGFSIAIISVVYAVLLAFIAVATWESFAAADNVVQAEAGYINNLYRDTRGFPDPMGERMRAALSRYADTVVNREWPLQRQGLIPNDGWKPLHEVHAQLVAFQPATQGQGIIEAEFLRTLNELYKARGARLTAAAGHIPGVIWWIIGIGGALTTAFTYLFGFESFRLHLTMTGAVAASLALVVVLIVALDWPFRGEVSVSPDAYIDVQQSWQAEADESRQGDLVIESGNDRR